MKLLTRAIRDFVQASLEHGSVSLMLLAGGVGKRMGVIFCPMQLITGGILHLLFHKLLLLAKACVETQTSRAGPQPCNAAGILMPRLIMLQASMPKQYLPLLGQPLLCTACRHCAAWLRLERLSLYATPHIR